MFKVSLLPESYRKQLIGKKNKDMVIYVALVVLVCMLIVYAGFAVKLLILKGQLKDVNKQNNNIQAKINELSPYVNNYNDLAIAEANIENIKPADITALEMVNIIQNITPDYIQLTALYAPNWQRSQVIVIEGDFAAANTLGTSSKMLNSYTAILRESSELKDKIVDLKVTGDAPLNSQDSSTGEVKYSFRIIISLKGAITVDPQTGTLTTTTTATTTTETTTVPPETEPTTVEASTIA